MGLDPDFLIYNRPHHPHPPTHQSARWSADPANIQTYLDNGRRMDDVRDVPLREALRDVPAAEARDRTWPYEVL